MRHLLQSRLVVYNTREVWQWPQGTQLGIIDVFDYMIELLNLMLGPSITDFRSGATTQDLNLKVIVLKCSVPLLRIYFIIIAKFNSATPRDYCSGSTSL